MLAAQEIIACTGLYERRVRATLSVLAHLRRSAEQRTDCKHSQVIQPTLSRTACSVYAGGERGARLPGGERKRGQGRFLGSRLERLGGRFGRPRPLCVPG